MKKLNGVLTAGMLIAAFCIPPSAFPQSGGGVSHGPWPAAGAGAGAGNAPILITVTNNIIITNRLSGAGLAGVNGYYSPYAGTNTAISLPSVHNGSYYMYGEGPSGDNNLNGYPIEIDNGEATVMYYFSTNGITWYTNSQCVQPCHTPPTGTMITNYVTQQQGASPDAAVFTNNMVWFNGQYYNESNSTTAGIQEAINLCYANVMVGGQYEGVAAGQRIKIGPGIFQLGSTITMSSIILDGSGRFSTVLLQTNTSPIVCIYASGVNNDIYHMMIASVTNAPVNLVTWASYYGEISDVTFTWWTPFTSANGANDNIAHNLIGVMATGGWGPRIVNCEFEYVLGISMACDNLGCITDDSFAFANGETGSGNAWAHTSPYFTGADVFLLNIGEANEAWKIGHNYHITTPYAYFVGNVARSHTIEGDYFESVTYAAVATNNLNGNMLTFLNSIDTAPSSLLITNGDFSKSFETDTGAVAYVDSTHGRIFASGNTPFTGNASGLTNLNALSWNVGANTFLSANGGTNVPPVSGLVLCNIATTNTAQIMLTDLTTHAVCIFGGGMTVGAINFDDNSGLLPVNGGDTVALTNLNGTGTYRVDECRFIHLP